MFSKTYFSDGGKNGYDLVKGEVLRKETSTLVSFSAPSLEMMEDNGSSEEYNIMRYKLII